MNTSQRPPLTKGRALVISGPQGCGKSLLARQIAMGQGKFQQISTGANFEFELHDALQGKPDVLIIDVEASMPTGKEMVQIKEMLTSQIFLMRRPYGGGLQRFKSPMVIMCSADKAWAEQNRRCDIIDLGQEAATGVAA